MVGVGWIRTRVLLILVIVALISMPLLNGCQKEVNGDIRVGYFPNVTHAVPLVGLEQQTFQKELGTKVNIKTKTFVAGPSLMEALIAGEIDVGYIGPVPAINGFVKGAGIKIIAGANNGGAVLVARKNSGIKTINDLINKKVAVPQFANTQDISLRHLLKANGLKDKAKGGNVNVLQVAPADLFLLFKQKQIDAALVPEPWGTQLKEKGEADIILDWRQVWNNGDYPTTVVIASDKFIKEHPEIVDKWLKAHVATVEFINNNKEKSQAIIKKRLKELTGQDIAINTIKASMDRSKTTDTLNKGVLDEFANLSFESGYLKSKPDISNLYVESYLQKAKK